MLEIAGKKDDRRAGSSRWFEESARHMGQGTRVRVTTTIAVCLMTIVGVAAFAVVRGADMAHVGAALLLLLTVGGMLGAMVLPGRGVSES